MKRINNGLYTAYDNEIRSCRTCGSEIVFVTNKAGKSYPANAVRTTGGRAKVAAWNPHDCGPVLAHSIGTALRTIGYGIALRRCDEADTEADKIAILKEALK
jgi:hypothetical protein